MNDSHEVNFKTFIGDNMSNQISQKEAVVNGVKSILGSNFDPSLPAKDQLSKDQISTLKNNVVDGIINGNVSFNKDTNDLKEVARYVNGMVSNHFRKAKELNGGSTYSPQSTGRGSRDSQVSELNKLLKTFEENTEEYNQIVEAIALRKAVLTSEKSETLKEKRKQKELASIDTNALPESLRSLATSLVSENA